MIIAVSRVRLALPEEDINPPDAWRVVVDRECSKHERIVSFALFETSIVPACQRIKWPDGPIMIVVLSGSQHRIRVRLEFMGGWTLFDETATEDTAWTLDWQKSGLLQ